MAAEDVLGGEVLSRDKGGNESSREAWRGGTVGLFLTTYPFQGSQGGKVIKRRVGAATK